MDVMAIAIARELPFLEPDTLATLQHTPRVDRPPPTLCGATMSALPATQRQRRPPWLGVSPLTNPSHLIAIPPRAGRIVVKLWSYCTVLRDDGLSYGDYLEQLSVLLFLTLAHGQSQPP